MAEESKPKSSIHIARAEKADKAIIMALAAEDHAESIFGDLPFSEAKFSTLFDKSINQPGRCITLKAEVKGEIVGFLYCNLGEYFIAENNLQANIHVVYVKEELRHNMLGGRPSPNGQRRKGCSMCSSMSPQAPASRKPIRSSEKWA